MHLLNVVGAEVGDVRLDVGGGRQLETLSLDGKDFLCVRHYDMCTLQLHYGKSGETAKM